MVSLLYFVLLLLSIASAKEVVLDGFTHADKSLAFQHLVPNLNLQEGQYYIQSYEPGQNFGLSLAIKQGKEVRLSLFKSFIIGGMFTGALVVAGFGLGAASLSSIAVGGLKSTIALSLPLYLWLEWDDIMLDSKDLTLWNLKLLGNTSSAAHPAGTFELYSKSSGVLRDRDDPFREFRISDLTGALKGTRVDHQTNNTFNFVAKPVNWFKERVLDEVRPPTEGVFIVYLQGTINQDTTKWLSSLEVKQVTLESYKMTAWKFTRVGYLEP